MIRLARTEDFDAIWPFFARVVRAGETYALDPSMQADEARAYWMAPSVRTYVADRDGVIEGTYLVRPNQPGLGNHVANASFMVDPDRAGRGIGRALVEHCLVEARALGYLAMQFNLVVATKDLANFPQIFKDAYTYHERLYLNMTTVLRAQETA